MTLLSITIVHPLGIPMTANVSDDSEMRYLMPAMADKLSFAKYDQNGDTLVYKLRREKSGDILDDSNTLSGIGVEENEKFTVVSLRLVQVNTGTDSKRDSKDAQVISAPIRIPKQESLTIGLVPSDLVYRLEEYRSDQMRLESVMWIFVGAIIGIIVNWVTTDPIIFTRSSIVLIIIFTVVAVILWIVVRDHKKRSEKIKDKIEKEMYS